MDKKSIVGLPINVSPTFEVLEKENTRRELLETANKLAITAKQLAIVAKEKEIVRRKLEVTAKEKESARRKLLVTAKQLSVTANQLAVVAKEKENTRRKLVITAKKLAVTAKKLAIVAKEKESARRKLLITAKQLALTAEEKETVRRKLEITAKEKENTRRKLLETAKKLALTANQLAIVAKEKEIVRRKLLVTAKQLAVTAKQLAILAKEKEIVRRKLVVTAKEKENTRRKLLVTAKKLALTANQLAIVAKEKEIVRRKLEITAREKESARRKLVVIANKLKKSYETLENKVFERTKSLEMARAKEEAILLSIGDGLLVTDEKGDIILINRTAEKLLGKKSKEIVGKGFAEVMPLEDDKGNIVFLEKHPVSVALTANTAVPVRSTYYFERKDKTKFPVASIATPVILNGNVIGTIKVFRDVTSEREIDKAKTEFVSLASHQLRTPLTSIGWYTEMLLKGETSKFTPNQMIYLEEIYQGNQRMVELVNTLLDVSRIELGTFMSEPKPTDIVSLAEDVLDEQKQNILEKELIIIKKFSKGHSIFFTDPKLLHIVFQNLITNAVKYTPNKGIIEFTISFDKKKTILIKVSDTGYGIPKNQQKQIFTKLFRADNARDKDTSGTGLGLYIVKSIVENTGGKIWFNSPAHKSSTDKKQNTEDDLNPGTTFYVALTLDKVKK